MASGSRTEFCSLTASRCNPPQRLRDMSAAIDFIQYGERMVGEASPDYDDTLNRSLKTVVSVSGADEDAFVGFALRPVVAPSVGQFYRATDTDVGASWQTLTAAMVSD